MMETIDRLATFSNHSKLVNIVIEASKGSRIKLKYDAENRVFRAEKVLPLGLVFPFDFGFLPSTMAEDGDPLDVIVLSESGLPCGCVVLGSVIGVLKCEQVEKGQRERNDRLIAIPIDAKSHEPMQPMVAFDSRLKVAIGEFFVKYNELQGKEFTVLGMEGPKTALPMIENSIQAAQSESEDDGAAAVKKHTVQRARHAANASR